jgi:membrane protease YdiL (CAAX protease family)
MRFIGVLHRVFMHEGRLRAGWRFIALLILYFLGGPLLNPLLTRIHFPDRALNCYALSLNEGLDLAFIAAVSWIVCRIGRVRFSTCGLPLKDGAGRLFLEGVIWGIVPSILILIPIYLAGACSFEGFAQHGADLAKYAALWAVAFLLVGLSEEFTFRGCALTNLGGAIGFWPAAVVMSALFGLIHFLFKQNEGWVDPINIALYGLFWCFTLKRTGSLWFAVGFHAASDYADMAVFAEPNTGAGGNPVPGHLLDVRFHGAVWLTGGPRGTEASLLVLPILACLVYLFHKSYPAQRAGAERAANAGFSAQGNQGTDPRHGQRPAEKNGGE